MKLLLSSFTFLLLISNLLAENEVEYRPRPRVMRQFEVDRNYQQNQNSKQGSNVMSNMFCEIARMLQAVGTSYCNSPQSSQMLYNNNQFGNRNNNSNQQFGRVQQQQQQNDQSLPDMIREIMCRSIDGLMQQVPPECKGPR